SLCLCGESFFMRILLTNDDGVYAPGLRALRKELQKLGEVTVVAPAGEQSAVGHSITLLTPLLVQEVLDENQRPMGWAVEGPAAAGRVAVQCQHPQPGKRPGPWRPRGAAERGPVPGDVRPPRRSARPGLLLEPARFPLPGAAPRQRRDRAGRELHHRHPLAIQ